jgi:hypothetical protein
LLIDDGMPEVDGAIPSHCARNPTGWKCRRRDQGRLTTSPMTNGSVGRRIGRLPPAGRSTVREVATWQASQAIPESSWVFGTLMVTWMATPIPAGFQDWQEQPA